MQALQQRDHPLRQRIRLQIESYQHRVACESHERGCKILTMLQGRGLNGNSRETSTRTAVAATNPSGAPLACGLAEVRANFSIWRSLEAA
jgi:hypothetical protein